MTSMTPRLIPFVTTLLCIPGGCVADGGSITATASDSADGGGTAGDGEDDGDDDDDDDEATDGSGDGDGDGDGDDDDDDDPTGDDDDDDDDDDDSDPPMECTEYIGDAPGDTVDLTIVNTSAETIYLDWYFGLPPLALAAPGVDWGWVGFGTSCTNIVSPGADSFCGEGIPIPQVLRIDPGAEYTYTWSGQLFEYQPIPLDCVHPDDASEWPCVYQEQCPIPHTPPAGSYTATLTAFPSFVAESPDEFTDCPGTACVIDYAWPDGDTFEAETVFDMPTGTVTVSF